MCKFNLFIKHSSSAFNWHLAAQTANGAANLICDRQQSQSGSQAGRQLQAKPSLICPLVVLVLLEPPLCRHATAHTGAEVSSLISKRRRRRALLLLCLSTHPPTQQCLSFSLSLYSLSTLSLLSFNSLFTPLTVSLWPRASGG